MLPLQSLVTSLRKPFERTSIFFESECISCEYEVGCFGEDSMRTVTLLQEMCSGQGLVGWDRCDPVCSFFDGIVESVHVRSGYCNEEHARNNSLYKNTINKRLYNSIKQNTSEPTRIIARFEYVFGRCLLLNIQLFTYPPPPPPP